TWEVAAEPSLASARSEPAAPASYEVDHEAGENEQRDDPGDRHARRDHQHHDHDEDRDREVDDQHVAPPGGRPHTGSLLQTALGRWRRTANNERRRPGTQTVCARRLSALAVASATASGVVAKGAALRPAVMPDLTNPGRTTRTRTPVEAAA